MPGIECGNPQPEIELRRVGRLADDDMGVGLEDTFRKTGGFRRPLLYQDCTIPQACCQAQRCQRSDSDVDTSVSGMAAYLSGWRTSWAISQSTYACTTSGVQRPLIQLMDLAQISPVELDVGDCLLHSAIPMIRSVLRFERRWPYNRAQKRSHNTDKILDQVFLPVLCQVDGVAGNGFDLASLHRQTIARWY